MAHIVKDCGRADHRRKALYIFTGKNPNECLIPTVDDSYPAYTLNHIHLHMKTILAAVAAFGLISAAHAETWIHIYRYDSPKISPSDPAPYDEYLDTDFVAFDGKWTFIKTKAVSDEASNEFHGKMEIVTKAFSCREYKFTLKSYIQFDDDAGRNTHLEVNHDTADLDRVGISIVPFRGIKMDANAPMMVYFRYACLGIKPV